MMCVSPIGEEFLEAIDTLGLIKDAIYIIDVIKRYLIEVKSENVVQVCMDNANTCTSKDAWHMHKICYSKIGIYLNGQALLPRTPRR